MSLLSENVAPANGTSCEIFLIVGEHFTTYCRCRESIKLPEFVLLSLTGICNSEQSYIFVPSAEGGGGTHVSLCILVEHRGVTKFECP
jgi:hypothetical protein